MSVPFSFAGDKEDFACLKILAGFGRTDIRSVDRPLWQFSNHTHRGRHGGLIHHVTRSEEDIANDFNFSGYEAHTGAPEGGVNRAIGTLGPIISDFIGLREFTDHSEIPDAAELNTAIDKINARLPDKIPQRFYAASESQVRRREYVQRQAAAAIPIAPEGSVMMHDISYHLTALFLMPPDVAKRSISLSKAVVNLCAFLEENFSDGTNVNFTQYIAHLYQEQLTVTDTQQGNVSILLSASNINKSLVHQKLLALSGNGSSTMHYLEQLHFRRRSVLNESEAKEVETLMAAFFKLHPEYRNDSLTEDPKNPWCEQFMKRRRAIADAIMEIEAEEVALQPQQVELGLLH